MQKHLRELAPTVKMVANKYYINSNITVEDLEQELWIKLITVNSTKPWFRQLDPVGQRRHTITFLSRKSIDIIRMQKRRKDTSDHCIRINPKDISKTLECEISNLSHPFLEPPQEVSHFYKDLEDVILNWACEQSKEIDLFAKELLSPSLETEKAWDNLRRKKSFMTPRYYSKNLIPPFALCRILKLENNVWHEFKNNLSIHLKDIGYQLQH